MFIKIKVFPGSKKEAIEEGKDRLRVFVRDQAQNNMANKAVIYAISKHLNIPQDAIRIVTGHQSQNKTLEIRKQPHD